MVRIALKPCAVDKQQMLTRATVPSTDVGVAGAQHQINDVPLYVNAKELVAADGSVEALELNYIMCFAHNGPHTIGGCFPVS